jgi:pimeloyl-ACP methyl ester carboxylesterase
MIRRAALSLALMVLASATAQPAVPSPDSRPRFVIGPCPTDLVSPPAGASLECGQLVVPESRRRPDGRTIQLAVVRLRNTAALEPSQTPLPPLVLLHGGPGDSGISRFLAPGAPLPRLRDVVIYDQRGAGFSQPAICADFGKQYTALLEEESSLAQADERIRGLARSCMATLLSQNIDPAAYTTAESAADLVDLRRALGYPQWDVYGVSYGTTLALAGLALDAGGIRAVLLDRPRKPGPWRLAEGELRAQGSLDRIFRACDRDASCHVAFPSPERDLAALFRKLQKKPLHVPATDSQKAFVLGGEKLILAIHLGLSVPRRIAVIPFLLRQLHAGDEVRAARELAGWISAATGYTALERLVNCNDQYGPGTLRLEKSALSRVSAPLKSLRRTSTLRSCDLWTGRFDDTPPAFPTGATNPVLIITGEFDPLTPPEDGRQIAAMLPNAHHYELPGESHGRSGSGAPAGCDLSIMSEFLADPTRLPNTSCILAMPPLRFVTSWEEMAAAERS